MGGGVGGHRLLWGASPTLAPPAAPGLDTERGLTPTQRQLAPAWPHGHQVLLPLPHPVTVLGRGEPRGWGV